MKCVIGIISFIAIIVVFIVVLVKSTRKCKRAKEKFLSEHEPLSDEKFFEQLTLPPEHYGLAFDIRKYLAEFCEIDPELIYPTDPISTLADLMWDFCGELRSIGKQIEIDYKMSKVRLKYKDWMRLEDSMVKDHKTVHDFIVEVIHRVEDAFMSNEEFCDALGLKEPLERAICILIRNESASCFHLSPDKVSVDNRTMPLNNRAMTPFIAFDIAPRVEDEISESLGSQINLESIFERMQSELPFSRQWIRKKKEAKTFGEWSLKLTKMISDHIVETVDKGIIEEWKKNMSSTN